MHFKRISMKTCAMLILIAVLQIILLFAVYLRYRDILENETYTTIEKRQQPISDIKSNEREATDRLRNLYKLERLAPSSSAHKSFNEDSLDEAKPWYFAGGGRYPKPAKISRISHKRIAKLLLSEDPSNDRITNQLMFVPPNYEEILETGKLKTVLLYNSFEAWGIEKDRNVFAECPVWTCQLTEHHKDATDAELILYKDTFDLPYITRSPNQIFMIYFLESPLNTPVVQNPSAFNWTATYRKDSTIVAPYEKWEYYDPNVKQMEQDRNFAQNKTKKVAWFASNCGAPNGRLNYATELQKYIDVDIYGSCGKLHCPRNNSEHCFDILKRDYKFYLAFENSNCKYYITEKIFVNALKQNILPIVMGARPEDYENSAPYGSYIHVDQFASPEKLAEYLHVLDKNDDLYNSYFRWKGTGEFINTFFWCRLCGMLHDDYAITTSPSYYDDINTWWRPKDVCTSDTW